MAKLLSSSQKIVSTKEFDGVRVVEARKKNDKRIGKIHGFVFHQSEKRVVGFIVKRPDLLLMFHRKDAFVALDGFSIEDGRVMIGDSKDATGDAAVKRLGLDWDNCVLWIGMPVVTRSGSALGYVGNVFFDRATGEVQSIELDAGAMNDAIVGKITIPASMVKGFKRGVGQEIVAEAEGEEGQAQLGAILVSDEAANIQAEGGAAAAAGEATAIAADKARKAVDSAKPKVEEAKRATGEAVEKGVHATGKQLGRSKKMFAEFKEEFDSALNEGSEGASAGGADSAAAKPKAAATTSGAATTSAKPAAAAGTKSAVKTPAKSTANTAASAGAKQTAKKSAKPAAKKQSQTTANAAAKSLGKQLGKASGMFSAFKEEFDKARKED